MIVEDSLKPYDVSLEVAKLAKEKGFNEMSRGAYTSDGKHIEPDNFFCNEMFNTWYSSPTREELATWLRKNHNLSVELSSVWSSESEEVQWEVTLSELTDLCPYLEQVGIFAGYNYALEQGMITALKTITI